VATEVEVGRPSTSSQRTREPRARPWGWVIPTRPR
jgi:hypothetical protein